MKLSPLRSCFFGLTACALALLGAPHPAAADAPSGSAAPKSSAPKSSAPKSSASKPSDSDVTAEAAASALAVKAVEAAAAGEKREAADLFGQAWSRYPLGGYICNRGALLFELGLLQEAAESLEVCLSPNTFFDGTLKFDSALKAVVRAQFDRARAESCRISISVNVPNAEILVDNQSVGRQPLDGSVFVRPGAHVVHAIADGYALDAKASNCPKGAWWDVPLVLDRPLKPGAVMSEPTSSPSGIASVPNDPGATRPARSTLFDAPSSGSGNDPQGSNRNMLAIVAGGVVTFGGAGLALGSFLAAASKGAAADDAEAAIASQDPAKACNGPTPDFKCGELNARLNSNRDSATLFTALGVGAAVLSAGGIALTVYAIVDGGSKKPQPGLSVRITPGLGSLAVSGTF